MFNYLSRFNPWKKAKELPKNLQELSKNLPKLIKHTTDELLSEPDTFKKYTDILKFKSTDLDSIKYYKGLITGLNYSEYNEYSRLNTKLKDGKPDYESNTFNIFYWRLINNISSIKRNVNPDEFFYIRFLQFIQESNETCKFIKTIRIENCNHNNSYVSTPISEFLKMINSCKNSLLNIIIPVILFDKVENFHHQNSLIVNVKDKKVWRLEPNWTKRDNNKKNYTNEALIANFKYTEYTFEGYYPYILKTCSHTGQCIALSILSYYYPNYIDKNMTKFFLMNYFKWEYKNIFNKIYTETCSSLVNALNIISDSGIPHIFMKCCSTGCDADTDKAFEYVLNTFQMNKAYKVENVHYDIFNVLGEKVVKPEHIDFTEPENFDKIKLKSKIKDKWINSLSLIRDLREEDEWNQLNVGNKYFKTNWKHTFNKLKYMRRYDFDKYKKLSPIAIKRLHPRWTITLDRLKNIKETDPKLFNELKTIPKFSGKKKWKSTFNTLKDTRKYDFEEYQKLSPTAKKQLNYKWVTILNKVNEIKKDYPSRWNRLLEYNPGLKAGLNWKKGLSAIKDKKKYKYEWIDFIKDNKALNTEYNWKYTMENIKKMKETRPEQYNYLLNKNN